MLRTDRLPEATIHEILANPRRRHTIRHLTDATTDGAIQLGDLAETIASRETGESPPPRSARESVYNSLHQTHLPKLEELGVLTYDRDNREVRVRERARELNVYLEVVTDHGLTWGEIYRALGVVGLTLVVMAETGIPFVSSIEPLLWATVFLVVLVVATSYQFWSNRWYFARMLRE